MSIQPGCLIFVINLILTLSFGVLLLLGYKPPVWGLLAVIVLDVIMFTVSGGRRRR
ncbi:MAG: hypothetical protein WCS37_13180 [Chloroflexota bacterium]|nr:hypothetical protein [Chloroflexota bacterium]